ncbi:sugar transferase [uncultured Desulfosarcina sp.]|uniref:sugar transferase n=1 Tax=uncultured Desulfosarcina sp. TaxID=218289 RepID=UPI0029C603C3|nr:sugar transferase [uncultured Desulfosarcina sp.]
MNYEREKRLFDITLCAFLWGLLALPLLIIGIAVKLSSFGPIIFWSSRIGLHNRLFRMPKFRTMKVDTPIVATHLLSLPDRHLTPVGKVLRKYSIDELPQFFSVLKGDMTFVGPRPALFNQDDLIHLRTEKGVHRLVPGITGWAQINGRDELPIPAKVELDDFYLKHRCFALDLRILFMTLFSVAGSKGIVH